MAWTQGEPRNADEFKTVASLLKSHGGEPHSPDSLLRGILSAMPSPSPRLTDSELEVLFSLAAPIAAELRQGFLAAVAEALASSPERGPGAAHRIARAAQAAYTLDIRRAAETEGVSRYSQKRFAPGGR